MILSYLNEDMELGNYPTEARVNENITLYFVVTSHWNEAIDIQVRHIIGKNTSVSLSSNSSSNGTIINSYNHTIQTSEEWESEQIVTTFSEKLGSNEHYLIIFELWAYLGSDWEFLEDQIVFNRINVTSS